MGFEVAADSYDRFMGRFSRQLSGPMVDLAELQPGQRALDVGCGPGALIEVLVERHGAQSVVGVDPSAPFVAAARQRHLGVRIEQAAAEQLPFGDGEFDAALAQLVVHFMRDPVKGIAEMGRVTRSGGRVVACVWDFAGGRGPLGVFWDAVAATDPRVPNESALPGTREGHLAELFAAAGLRDVDSLELRASIQCATFEEWWEPFTMGVGPAGSYVASLDERRRATLRETCREMLPPAPFSVSARAWAARGRVAG